MVERFARSVAAARLAEVARELLDASTLCSIATVTPSGRAYVSTAYFAWTPDVDIIWISHPDAIHSRNLAANSSAALAVYDSGQRWGGADRGIQLFGTARQVAGRAAHEAARSYAARFPAYEEHQSRAYTLYRFRPRRLKLFDEAALGAGVFVLARRAPAGELAWVRTEVYAPP